MAGKGRSAAGGAGDQPALDELVDMSSRVRVGSRTGSEEPETVAEVRHRPDQPLALDDAALAARDADARLLGNGLAAEGPAAVAPSTLAGVGAADVGPRIFIARGGQASPIAYPPTTTDPGARIDWSTLARLDLPGGSPLSALLVVHFVPGRGARGAEETEAPVGWPPTTTEGRVPLGVDEAPPAPSASTLGSAGTPSTRAEERVSWAELSPRGGLSGGPLSGAVYVVGPPSWARAARIEEGPSRPPYGPPLATEGRIDLDGQPDRPLAGGSTMGGYGRPHTSAEMRLTSAEVARGPALSGGPLAGAVHVVGPPVWAREASAAEEVFEPRGPQTWTEGRMSADSAGPPRGTAGSTLGAYGHPHGDAELRYGAAEAGPPAPPAGTLDDAVRVGGPPAWAGRRGAADVERPPTGPPTWAEGRMEGERAATAGGSAGSTLGAYAHPHVSADQRYLALEAAAGPLPASTLTGAVQVYGAPTWAGRGGEEEPDRPLTGPPTWSEGRLGGEGALAAGGTAGSTLGLFGRPSPQREDRWGDPERGALARGRSELSDAVLPQDPAHRGRAARVAADRPPEGPPTWTAGRLGGEEARAAGGTAGSTMGPYGSPHANADLRYGTPEQGRFYLPSSTLQDIALVFGSPTWAGRGGSVDLDVPPSGPPTWTEGRLDLERPVVGRGTAGSTMGDYAAPHAVAAMRYRDPDAAGARSDDTLARAVQVTGPRPRADGGGGGLAEPAPSGPPTWPEGRLGLEIPAAPGGSAGSTLGDYGTPSANRADRWWDPARAALLREYSELSQAVLVLGPATWARVTDRGAASLEPEGPPTWTTGRMGSGGARGAEPAGSSLEEAGSPRARRAARRGRLGAGVASPLAGVDLVVGPPFWGGREAALAALGTAGSTLGDLARTAAAGRWTARDLDEIAGRDTLSDAVVVLGPATWRRPGDAEAEAPPFGPPTWTTGRLRGDLFRVSEGSPVEAYGWPDFRRELRWTLREARARTGIPAGGMAGAVDVRGALGRARAADGEPLDRLPGFPPTSGDGRMGPEGLESPARLPGSTMEALGDADEAGPLREDALGGRPAVVASTMADATEVKSLPLSFRQRGSEDREPDVVVQAPGPHRPDARVFLGEAQPDRVCERCGRALMPRGTRRERRLERIHQRFEIHRILRPLYDCPTGHLEAPVASTRPAFVSMALPVGHGLLASLVTTRYRDFLELRRSALVHGALGVTMAHLKVGEELARVALGLRPVWQAMVDGARAAKRVRLSEPVSTRTPGNPTPRRGRLFAADDGVHTLFVHGDEEFVPFDGARARVEPGFDGMERLLAARAGVGRAGRLMEARRRFFLAYPQAPSDSAAGLERLQRADLALAAGADPAATLAPLHAWLLASAQHPAPAAHRANLEFLLAHWQVIVEDPAPPPAVRPVVPLWLMEPWEGGADTAEVFLSLVESCARHGRDPWVYLRDLFDALVADEPIDPRRWTPVAWMEGRA